MISGTIIVVGDTMSRGQDSEDRRHDVTLHLGVGRRYAHADLTAHRHKNRRRRRITLLVEKACRAMVRHYAAELQAAPPLFADFAAEVAHRLRAEAQPEWTLEQAEKRSLEIAEELFDELDSAGDPPAGDAS